MANTPPDSASDDTGATREQGQRSDAPPGVPRWIKISLIIVGILVLLVAIVKLTGLGGEHGPGRHTGAAVLAPLSVVSMQIPSGAEG